MISLLLSFFSGWGYWDNSCSTKIIYQQKIRTSQCIKKQNGLVQRNSILKNPAPLGDAQILHGNSWENQLYLQMLRIATAGFLIESTNNAMKWSKLELLFPTLSFHHKSSTPPKNWQDRPPRPDTSWVWLLTQSHERAVQKAGGSLGENRRHHHHQQQPEQENKRTREHQHEQHAQTYHKPNFSCTLQPL